MGAVVLAVEGAAVGVVVGEAVGLIVATVASVTAVMTYPWLLALKVLTIWLCALGPMRAVWTAELVNAAPTTFTLYRIFTDAVERLLARYLVVLISDKPIAMRKIMISSYL